MKHGPPPHALHVSRIRLAIFLSTVARGLLRGGFQCSPFSATTSPLAPFVSGPINRMDSFFDRVFGEDGGFMSQAWSGAPVAMWEDDDHIHVEAELPGVADQDVD